MKDNRYPIKNIFVTRYAKTNPEEGEVKGKLSVKTISKIRF
jgi:hypothetical protein